MKDTLLWTVSLILGGLIVAQHDGLLRPNRANNYRNDLRSELGSELVRYRNSGRNVRMTADRIRAEVQTQRNEVLNQTREIQNELREATRRPR